MTQRPNAAPGKLREIEASDSAAIAKVIRTVMPEFGADTEGFAITDAEVSDMYAAYQKPGWVYYVAEINGRVVGGSGIAPLEGGEPDQCELRKMYLLSETRGSGLGRKLLEACLNRAEEMGYRLCYLETLEHMTAARGLYEKLGFRKLKGPMGNTGHFGCDSWYAKELG